MGNKKNIHTENEIKLMEAFKNGVEFANEMHEKLAKDEQKKDIAQHINELSSRYYRGKQIANSASEMVLKLIKTIPNDMLVHIYEDDSNDMFNAIREDIEAECISRNLIQGFEPDDECDTSDEYIETDESVQGDMDVAVAFLNELFEQEHIAHYVACEAFAAYEKKLAKNEYATSPEIEKLRQDYEHKAEIYREKAIELGHDPIRVYDEDIFHENIQSSTRRIYNVLKSKVYKQDAYCKKASTILYNHVHGIRSINAVSGPSGCGKTYLWEQVRDNIYPNVIILDGKSLSQNGFKGTNLNQLLAQIPFDDGIVVIDEFDKLITPNFESSGSNISRNIQSEFLKVLDDGFNVETRDDNGDKIVAKRSTKNMTFIFCGSFADKAASVAEENSGSQIGFISTKEKKQAYFKEITLEDMVDFGLIKELAGRIVDVISTNPLEIEDYVTFLQGCSNSAVHQIENQYGCTIKLSDEKIKEIAEKAHNSKLGFRKAINLIKTEVNNYIFENNGIKEDDEILLS